jgi:hypothetical protein
MREPESTVGDRSHPRAHHPTLAGLRADLAVVRQRGMGRIRRVWDSLPMYRPSRHPVGRGLEILHHLGPDSTPDMVEYREVLPRRLVPAGPEGSIDAPPLWACVVNDGTLVTDGVLFHGLLVHDGLLVAEVSADYRDRDGEWSSFRRLQRFPPRLHVSSGVSMLTGGGGLSNYGHWMYDVLPRLHLLRRAGLVTEDARYLLPPIDAEFKRSSLDRLGIDPRACIEVRGPVAIEADTLAASAGHRSHGRVEPWIPEFLRGAFLREAPTDRLAPVREPSGHEDTTGPQRRRAGGRPGYPWLPFYQRR